MKPARTKVRFNVSISGFDEKGFLFWALPGDVFEIDSKWAEKLLAAGHCSIPKTIQRSRKAAVKGSEDRKKHLKRKNNLWSEVERLWYQYEGRYSERERAGPITREIRKQVKFQLSHPKLSVQSVRRIIRQLELKKRT